MSNILISNGTCYSAAGKRLDESFIPCGNDAFGHQTCCGAGDNCLADRSCWGQHGTGYGSSLTYMAGCTDPEYKDAACPNKFYGQSMLTSVSADSGLTWAKRPTMGRPHALRQQQRHLGHLLAGGQSVDPSAGFLLQLHQRGILHDGLQRRGNAAEHGFASTSHGPVHLLFCGLYAYRLADRWWWRRRRRRRRRQPDPRYVSYTSTSSSLSSTVPTTTTTTTSIFVIFCQLSSSSTSTIIIIHADEKLTRQLDNRG